MQHPDEGSIHAWLDGALSDGEAGRVSEHIRSCASCSERVAEARGLIAASSRILGKLDEVASAVPVQAGHGGPQLASRRAWWISPRMAAAAAVLVVAAGTWASLRDRGQPLSDMTNAPVAADSAAADVAPAARADETLNVQADRRSTGGAGGATAPAPATTRRGARETELAGNQTAASPSGRAAPPVVTGAVGLGKQAARSEEIQTMAERAARPGEVVSDAARRTTEPARRNRNELAAGAPLASVVQTAPRAMSQSEVDSVVNLFAGCYNAVRGERAINDGFPAQISLLNRLHRRVGDQQTWVAAPGTVVPGDVTWEWTLGAAFNVALQRVSGGPVLNAEFSSGSGADIVLRRIDCR